MALVKWIHLRQLTPLTEIILGAGRSAPGAGVSAAAGRSAPGAGSEAAPRTSQPARSTPEAASSPSQPARSTPQAPDWKADVLGAIREQNKVLFGMVVAQAQKVEAEGDTLVFTFAPVHKALKAQFDAKRTWVEKIAQEATGRRIKVVAKEGQAAPRPASNDESGSRRKAELTARAKAEPSVQAVLDVFGGEIEDVEEIE
jgi:hypothetical protein